MKRALFILVIFLTVQTLSAQIQLFESLNLSNEYGPSREQQLAQDNNSLYLVWNNWGDIRFRKSDNGGFNWAGKLTLYTGTDYGANYPVVAASQGKVYVAYYRNTSGNSQIFLVRSTNNGQSFGNEIQVTNAIRGAIVPQIAASGDTVVIAYEDRDINYKYQIFLIRSVNGGLSWSAPVQVTNTSTAARWVALALRGQEIYLFWNEQTGSNYDHLDLMFAKSTNFGQSFSPAVNISSNQAYNARLKARVIDNSIYVAVQAKADPLQSDIFLYRSHNLGQTWENPVNLSQNSGNSSRPELWVERNSPGNHRIYVVWSDNTYSANERAYLRFSNDHGSSWSQLNQFSQNTEDAAWPVVAVRNEGQKDRLYLAWNRPNDGTFVYEVWGRRAENTLSQMVIFSGTVKDPQGAPIAGATVSLSGYLTFTLPDGSFSAEVPAGTYNLQVMAAGYQTYGNPAFVLNQNMVLHITLQPLVPGNYPPHLLSASLQNVNQLGLQWESPIGFNPQELKYDDGEPNGYYWPGQANGNEWMAVAFQLNQNRALRQLKAYLNTTQGNEPMLIWVLGDNNGLPDLNTVLGGPFLMNIHASGWHRLAVNIPIPAGARFYIACQWNSGNSYRLAGDLNQPDGFSYVKSGPAAAWTAISNADLMVRAGVADESGRELMLEPLGYKVYHNGQAVGGLITQTNYQFEELTVGQTHTFGVSAVYPAGESPQATLQVEVPQPLLFPPLSLTAQLELPSTIRLNWQPPASSGTWMQWGNDQNFSAVGGANVQIFDAAIRFTPADLQVHHGKYLTRIAAFIASDNCQIFLRVWQGGNQYYAGNLVREQLVTTWVPNNWNEFELINPVQIDASQELWLGYRVINTAGAYPAGVDNGPAVPFKGDMLLYGSNWVSMSDYFGWNINWNLKGMVVSAQSQGLQPGPLESSSALPNTGHPQLNPFPQTPSRIPPFTHYKIYRNGDFIDSTETGVTTYGDDAGAGGGLYHITSAWGSFESQPSNSVLFVVSGLQSTDNEDVIRIYPVPGKADQVGWTFSNSLSGKIALGVWDANGRKLAEIQTDILGKGSFAQLGVRSAGIYFVRVVYDAGEIWKKVIITP